MYTPTQTSNMTSSTLSLCGHFWDFLEKHQSLCRGGYKTVHGTLSFLSKVTYRQSPQYSHPDLCHVIFTRIGGRALVVTIYFAVLPGLSQSSADMKLRLAWFQNANSGKFHQHMTRPFKKPLRLKKCHCHQLKGEPSLP